jgi:hypothetical protein
MSGQHPTMFGRRFVQKDVPLGKGGCWAHLFCCMQRICVRVRTCLVIFADMCWVVEVSQVQVAEPLVTCRKVKAAFVESLEGSGCWWQLPYRALSQAVHTFCSQLQLLQLLLVAPVRLRLSV